MQHLHKTGATGKIDAGAENENDHKPAPDVSVYLLNDLVDLFEHFFGFIPFKINKAGF